MGSRQGTGRQFQFEGEAAAANAGPHAPALDLVVCDFVAQCLG